MLPFLKPKTVAGLIIAKRKPDGGKEEQGMEHDENQGLSMAAEDLIRAVHAKDAQAVCDALRSAFEIMESEPHEEAESPASEPQKE